MLVSGNWDATAPTERQHAVQPSPQGGDGLGRALDVSVSLLALVFLLPVFIAVALALKIADPGPILFAHRRIGRGGRDFFCLKFRSMTVDADARLHAYLAASPTARAEWNDTHKLQHDPRVTPLGRFLRKSSLDELPQLINILRGEMSLVGPRPIVAAERRRYRRYFQEYCSVRPGVTGLWQVSGRSSVSYRRRVAMDVLYVRRKSLWLDLKLLALTVPAVLTRDGAV